MTNIFITVKHDGDGADAYLQSGGGDGDDFFIAISTTGPAKFEDDQATFAVPGLEENHAERLAALIAADPKNSAAILALFCTIDNLPEALSEIAGIKNLLPEAEG